MPCGHLCSTLLNSALLLFFPLLFLCCLKSFSYIKTIRLKNQIIFYFIFLLIYYIVVKKMEKQMANIDEILARLDKVRRVKNGRYMACCPVHDDKKPSLSITETSDDKIIMHCFGCGANGLEVCNALAVDISCLFPEDVKNYHKTNDNIRNRDPMNQFVSEQVVLNIQNDVFFVAFLAQDLAAGKPICESDIERLKSVSRTLLTNMKKIV